MPETLITTHTLISKKKIDCVLIPPYLENAKPNPINIQRRYREYILPYVNYLDALGAKKYNIKGYGKVIVFE